MASVKETNQETAIRIIIRQGNIDGIKRILLTPEGNPIAFNITTDMWISLFSTPTLTIKYITEATKLFFDSRRMDWEGMGHRWLINDEYDACPYTVYFFSDAERAALLNLLDYRKFIYNHSDHSGEKRFPRVTKEEAEEFRKFLNTLKIKLPRFDTPFSIYH